MEKLISLYNIASPSGKEKQMAKFIIAELNSMGITYKKDRCGNVYAVKGNAKTYPCIVSHMDEVHRRKTGTYGVYAVDDKMIVGYDYLNRKMTGIGADDKNGIWICLKALENFKDMKCVFFVKEEIGCIGSGGADMDFFSDCRYVIQCDRKGNSDIITNIGMSELCSREFIEKIHPERYGYTVCSGMTTDIHTLKTRGLGISCINLSCGYYNPHTDNEYTIWEDLLKCFHFVCYIVKTYQTVSIHIPKHRQYPRIGWFNDDNFYCSRLDYSYNKRLKKDRNT